MTEPADGVVIRVKRRRSQDPVEVLLVEKRSKKTLVEEMEGLSLRQPVKFVFRRKQFPGSVKTPQSEDLTEIRSQAAAAARFELKIRHRVIDFQLEEIECNGVPMRVCKPASTDHFSDANFEIDEYQAVAPCEDDDLISKAFLSIEDLLEPRLMPEGSQSSYDSEDSNAENRPENDYPDEESFHSSASSPYQSSEDECLY